MKINVILHVIILLIFLFNFNIFLKLSQVSKIIIMKTLLEQIKKYSGVTTLCESSPTLLGKKISSIVNNEKGDFSHDIKILLNCVADEGKNHNDDFPIGDGKHISITDKKSVENYINSIINNLTISNEVKKAQAIKEIKLLQQKFETVASGGENGKSVEHRERKQTKTPVMPSHGWGY